MLCNLKEDKHGPETVTTRDGVRFPQVEDTSRYYINVCRIIRHYFKIHGESSYAKSDFDLGPIYSTANL